MKNIPQYYGHIFLDKYVIMPNHVHAIIVTEPKNITNLISVIGQYKMSVTKKIRVLYPEMQVWQRSFHDHIIRNQKDYERIWNYIENNPEKWEEDCFYRKTEDD